MQCTTSQPLASQAAPLAIGTYLQYCGPARVVAVLGQDLELQTPDEERIWARLAIAITYQPHPGDIVLALATTETCYVVGILEGSGATVLNAPGDLELRAPDGEIRIAAGQSCVVTTPNLRMQADELDLIGGTLHEEFQTVRRRITGAIETRARAITTTVVETYRLVAQRICTRGEENVRIEAPSINLG